MTPRIFKWLRREEPPQPPRILRTEPCSLGIDDSTCEVTESVSNPCKLPILPSLDPSRESHHHELSASSAPANPQRQSVFFKLPVEIRQQIYTEVLGGRRVHIDYDFAYRTGWRNMKKKKKKKKKKYDRQWRWWHHVCADGNSFIEDDALYDGCPCRVSEETEDWTRDGRAIKIRGAGWLRTCRRGYIDAIPVLYGTNTFVTRYALDISFRMARILPAPQRSLITALDIKIGIAMGHTPDFTKDWEITYPKFFHMLQHSFPNVRKLRLGIDMLTFNYSTRHMTAEDLDRFLGPWESLVTSRDWELVELRVPESWYPELWPRAECQGGYKLSTIRDMFLSHDRIGCFP